MYKNFDLKQYPLSRVSSSLFLWRRKSTFFEYNDFDALTLKIVIYILEALKNTQNYKVKNGTERISSFIILENVEIYLNVFNTSENI